MMLFSFNLVGLCRVKNQPCIAQSYISKGFQQGLQGMQGCGRAHAGKKPYLHFPYFVSTLNIFSRVSSVLTLHTLHTLLKRNTSNALIDAGLVFNPAQPCTVFLIEKIK